MALAAGLLCSACAVAVAAAIFANSSGNHQQVGEISLDILQRMLGFGLSYFFLNPLERLFRIESVSTEVTIGLGLLKLLVIFAVFWNRRLLSTVVLNFFFVLLALDLGNAALLAIGRYHTGV